MNAFLPAEILIPKNAELKNWSVVACDQYTSEPEYWKRVAERTKDVPSTAHLILPEAELNAPDVQEKIDAINAEMERYLQSEIFAVYPASYIYVERTLSSGAIRRGIVGRVDLEQYDYSKGSVSAIRATEGTVLERIPPRKRVRKNAPIELPHILLLTDDPEDLLLGAVEAAKDSYEKVYDFDLMEQGGHITGWLLSKAAAAEFDERMSAFTAAAPEKYSDLAGASMVIAVGDGNHSLATAKACYEELKAEHPGEDLSQHPARFALAELGNIHDAALEFEPIHRVVTNTEPEALLAELKQACCADEGYPLVCVTASGETKLFLDPKKGELAVGILQSFLDRWLPEHPGEIDYIHGEEVTHRLGSAPDAAGFLLPPMEKRQLFRGVIAEGVLPRKTFSMGHANEKRFYLEGRKIR